MKPIYRTQGNHSRRNVSRAGLQRYRVVFFVSWSMSSNRVSLQWSRPLRHPSWGFAPAPSSGRGRAVRRRRRRRDIHTKKDIHIYIDICTQFCRHVFMNRTIKMKEKSNICWKCPATSGLCSGHETDESL